MKAMWRPCEAKKDTPTKKMANSSTAEAEVTRYPNGYTIQGERRNYGTDGSLWEEVQTRLHSEFVVLEDTGWTTLSSFEYDHSETHWDGSEYSERMNGRISYGNLEESGVYMEEYWDVYMEEEGRWDEQLSSNGYIQKPVKDGRLEFVLSFLSVTSAVSDGYFSAMIRKAATGSI